MSPDASDGRHPRAEQLIAELGLAPHPEGGFYREIARSDARVRPLGGRPERSALTVIHFLLTAGRGSRLHRVASDEVWHWIEGAPIELVVVRAGATRPERATLGPLAGGALPVSAVPAGAWQAARAGGPFALAACVVAPGFEFEDFELLADAPLERDALLRRFPELAEHV